MRSSGRSLTVALIRKGHRHIQREDVFEDTGRRQPSSSQGELGNHFKRENVSIQYQEERAQVRTLPDTICQNGLWHVFGINSTILMAS